MFVLLSTSLKHRAQKRSAEPLSILFTGHRSKMYPQMQNADGRTRRSRVAADHVRFRTLFLPFARPGRFVSSRSCTGRSGSAISLQSSLPLAPRNVGVEPRVGVALESGGARHRVRLQHLVQNVYALRRETIHLRAQPTSIGAGHVIQFV